jgi:hypothetical protein
VIGEITVLVIRRSANVCLITGMSVASSVERGEDKEERRKGEQARKEKKKGRLRK